MLLFHAYPTSLLRHFSQHKGADEELVPTPLLEHDIRQRSRETAAQNRKGWWTLDFAIQNQVQLQHRLKIADSFVA